MKLQETNSRAHAGAETSIAISTEDILWIRKTLNGQSLKGRLHEVITLYRKQVLGEKV